MKKILLAAFIALTALNVAECTKKRVKKTILSEDTQNYIAHTATVFKAFETLLAEASVQENTALEEAIRNEAITIVKKRTEFELYQKGVKSRITADEESMKRYLEIIKKAKERAKKKELKIYKIVTTDKKTNDSDIAKKILKFKMKKYNVLLCIIVKEFSAETLGLFLEHVFQYIRRIVYKHHTLTTKSQVKLGEVLEEAVRNMSMLTCSACPDSGEFPISIAAGSKNVTKYNLLIIRYADDEAKCKISGRKAKRVIRNRTLRSRNDIAVQPLRSDEYFGEIKDKEKKST